VIRAPASARNRADLAFGGGFRDHRRRHKTRAAVFIPARIPFDFVVYADERRYRELVVTRGPRGRLVVGRTDLAIGFTPHLIPSVLDPDAAEVQSSLLKAFSFNGVAIFRVSPRSAGPAVTGGL